MRSTRLIRRLGAELPELTLDVALGLDEEIDDRAIVEVLLEQLGGDPAPVQLEPLLDLLVERLVEVIGLQPFEDLVLVVQ